MANRNRMLSTFISPVRASSSVPPIADGRPATIPAKMMMEMPLPTPRSVTCSPSQTRNIVPVTRVATDETMNEGPTFVTSPDPPTDWLCRAMEIPMAWKVASTTVP
jgi:hypothetical protein